MKPEIDVLIFGGQSNMQGGSEGLPADNTPVPDAWQYHYLTDSLDPLCDPAGDPLGNPTLIGEERPGGSLMPSACRTYIRETGRPVVAIHVARGGTRIDEWMPDTQRYALGMEKIQAGLRKVREQYIVRHVYYVWLQGESDAINRTTSAEYKERLTVYKEALKRDAGIEMFGIIQVGYFCCTVSWLTDRTKEDARACDETIIQAQAELPDEDPDFVLLTDICPVISLDAVYINPGAEGHYNNRGLTRIGEETGKALAKLG